MKNLSELSSLCFSVSKTSSVHTINKLTKASLYPYASPPPTNQQGTQSTEKKSSISNVPQQNFGLKFFDAVDPVEQIKFRRQFMRRTKPNEVDVVTLQDIKDVVFFLLATKVPADFINFFYTEEVNRFLRALILYFQYYLEVWQDVEYRVQNSANQLKHPVGYEREEIVTHYLSELRCLVARDYCLVLLGSGTCKRFHHMANKERRSIAERDLKLFELLYCFSSRVVWVAFNRLYFHIIENEVNRLFRSDHYNLIQRRRKFGPDMTGGEHSESNRKVLQGKSLYKERKLLARSPAAHEITGSISHPFQLLQLGLTSVQDKDEFHIRLEDQYRLPEEYLDNPDLSVGILGHPRDLFDPLLVLKEKSSTDKRLIRSGLPEIFPGKRKQIDALSCTSASSAEDIDTNLHTTSTPKQGNEDNEDDKLSSTVIVQTKEFYIELHKARSVIAKKLWIGEKSIKSH